MPNQRKKGNKAQRVAAAVLKKWTKKPFASTPRSGGLRWGNMSTVIGDVVCTKEGHYFPFSVEVKFYKEINFEHTLYTDKGDVKKFWEQACEDALRAKKLPMLMMRYNRLPVGFFFVGLRISHYKKLFLGFNHLELKRVMILKHLDLAIITTPELVLTDYKQVKTNAKLLIKALNEKT
jgi:hypothetical protein